MKSTAHLQGAAALGLRNAFADIEHINTSLVAEGEDATKPIVTIVIPTYKRLEFLTQALESVLNQTFDAPYEILVIDDDPKSTMVDRILERLPDLRRRCFRYFVNGENLGLYPNHNRGGELARGEWVTFLNDDDLLDPDYLRVLIGAVQARPEIAAIIPRKYYFEDRATHKHATAPQSMAHRIASRGMLEARFLGRAQRPIAAGKFFWGAVVGGSGGCLFKRSNLLHVGGFYPEEHPASDGWLMVRYARLYGLWQHRGVLIQIRIAENESTKLETMKQGFVLWCKLQKALIGDEVPSWYGRILPLVIARERAEFRDVWKAEIPKKDLEQALGMPLHERPVIFRVAQIALRGF